MVVMMVLMAEMMMIPMKSSSMAMTMASISPSGREFPLADSYLPESFSLSVLFRPVAAAEYFSRRAPDLRFSWERYTRMISVRGGPGWPDIPRRGQHGAHAWALSGPMVAHPGLPFWLPPSSRKIGTSGIFLEFSDLPKYGVLVVTFPAEFQLRQ